jgi:hypothetical protein
MKKSGPDAAIGIRVIGCRQSASVSITLSEIY